MTWLGGFKDLPRKTASDKAFSDKVFNNAKNPMYEEYQQSLASMVHKCFDKKTSGSNTSVSIFKSEIVQNQELGKELHKPNI